MRRFTLVTIVALLILVMAAGFLSYWIGTHRHLRPLPTPTLTGSPPSTG